MTSTSKRSVLGYWHNVGTLTVANGELSKIRRAVATVDALAVANTIKIAPSTPEPYGMLIRFRSDAGDGVTDTLHMYAARGNDFYSRIAILGTVVGTNDADGSLHFIETINPSEEDGHHDAEEQNRTTDRTAHYYLRTFGCDRFIIVAATLNSGTLYCDVCWLWE